MASGSHGGRQGTARNARLRSLVRQGRLTHVAPPFHVLERMATLRLHLDPVDDDNAPLLVAPGSHRLGRVPEPSIPAQVDRLGIIPCLADAGDIWAYATPNSSRFRNRLAATPSPRVASGLCQWLARRRTGMAGRLILRQQNHLEPLAGDLEVIVHHMAAARHGSPPGARRTNPSPRSGPRPWGPDRPPAPARPANSPLPALYTPAQAWRRGPRPPDGRRNERPRWAAPAHRGSTPESAPRRLKSVHP